MMEKMKFARDWLNDPTKDPHGIGRSLYLLLAYWHLLVQSQQWKQNHVAILLKINPSHPVHFRKL